MDISPLSRTLLALCLLTTPAVAMGQTDADESSESADEESDPGAEDDSDSDADEPSESADEESDPGEEDNSDSDADEPSESADEESDPEEEDDSDSDADAGGDQTSSSAADEPGTEAGAASADEDSSEPAEEEDPQQGDSTSVESDEDAEAPTGEESGASADDASGASADEEGDDAASDEPTEEGGGEKGGGEETAGEADTAPPPQPPKRKGVEGEKQADENESDEEGTSPISDLAESSDEEGFEPVEDIEEDSLEEITPAELYPHVEWDGLFRVRSDADINFDLDTRGTSAIRPPIESTGDNPAKSGNELLWTADTGLRLDPTIHISETLSVHVEAGILQNAVFGALPDTRLTDPDESLRPDPSRTVFQSNQLSPREREWYEDAVQINELWGEIDTFLGEFRAGRMDNDWGVGIHANGGDCPDCNYGDHVDRFEFTTKPLGLFYTSAAIDFPDQGVTSQSANRSQGQAYDLSHIDDARQYTFSIFDKPRSQKEKKLEQQKLKEDQIPVLNGGARFTYRNQKGLYTDQVSTGPNGLNGQLIYRGLNMYAPDLWAQLLYNPGPDTYVRVELEGVGVFGDIDNATREPVRDSQSDVNCFEEGARDNNPDVCSSNDEADDTSQGLSQIGAALESELYFGGPVRFGLNSGYASGGNSANWGYQATDGSQHDFFRFDPNYHVDLILFREVVGTVTNAYYANPYAQARFFESPDQRMEVQLDAIASRASNIDGTPAGSEGDGWLGFELDAAIRYLQIDQFQAGLEGGVLFPFGALDAKLGRDRLTRPGGTESTFNQNRSASIPWTIQTNFIWMF